jgi:hypothetical protein
MQNCYWALWKWTALVWMYLIPKSFLGLLSCTASYFLVLWFTWMSRRFIRDLRLTSLLPARTPNICLAKHRPFSSALLSLVMLVQAPVAGLFLKRNVFLAFIIQLGIVSVVGWQAICSMFAWLITSTTLLMLHAALRRPSWHLNLIATASTVKRPSRQEWSWWGAGDQPEGVTYFGYVAMFSESATRSPPEGFKSLTDDCRKRLARFVRRRHRYLQGWLSDVSYALRFEWFNWCEAIQQRRARRVVLRGVAKHRRRRLIPWSRNGKACSTVGDKSFTEDGDMYL